MPDGLRTLAVIPARLASTRLPGKVLLPLAGRPMLAWVYEAARASAQLSQVLIATDSSEVMSFAQASGYPAVFTPADCASGTDRLQAVARSFAADIYVNIQGDEPLLRSEHVDALLTPFRDPAVEVTTLATPCSPADVANPNAVKVVLDCTGRALYFSRAAIPFDRDRTGTVRYRKHLGLYAYRAGALARFAAMSPGTLESAERLEQLRFLENGIPIHVAESPYETIGVDTAEDLAAAEAYLRQRCAP